MPQVMLIPKSNERGVDSWDEPETELPYLAMGSEWAPDVYAVCQTQLAANYLGMWLQKYTVNHLGAGIWDVSAHYGKQRPVIPGIMVFKGETTGKTLHREQSLGTSSSYYSSLANLQATPDFKGLIGVSKDNVAGVDVVTGGFKFTMQKKYLATQVPAFYLSLLMDLTGQVANTPLVATWKGQILSFDVGEILYLGASIDDGGQDQDGVEIMTINHQFEFSKNDDNLTVGGIDGIEKAGWDYLWCLYRDVVNQGYRAKEIVAVYVEQVYEQASFAVLQL